MKTWTHLLLLTIFDFVIIWLWVRQENPDPSVTIGLLIVIPFVIFLNLVIAVIVYWTNRKYTKLFVINSIISAVIMYVLFISGIKRNVKLNYETWEFNIKDTTFNISHYKANNTFDITCRTSPGSSWSFMNGQFIDSNNCYLLKTGSVNFKIKSNYLFNFRGSDSIKLKIVGY